MQALLQRLVTLQNSSPYRTCRAPVPQDNFVHTDLHPGNILCRPARDAAAAEAGEVELVLLDYGLAEELTGAVRRHFVSFLMCIGAGDGRAATRHLLRWGTVQRCEDREALEADMVRLFRERCDVEKPGGIDVDAVMKAVLQLCRKHGVTIDSQYAALAIGVCVVMGFATSLDPDVNLMDAAIPCFLAYSLTGRVTGRLYM